MSGACPTCSASRSKWDWAARRGLTGFPYGFSVLCETRRRPNLRGEMPRVLIPFSDLASATRAIRRLLARPRDPRLDVELLAIVDPLTSGKVGVFVSRERAQAQSTAAAHRWLRELAPMLDGAGVRWTPQIAIGRRRDILQHAGTRADIDEVLLGTRERDPLRHWRRRFVAHAMARPLVSIS